MKSFKIFLCAVIFSTSFTLFFSCSKTNEIVPVSVFDGSNSDTSGSNGLQSGSQGEITLYRVNNGTITKIQDYNVSGIDLNYQQDIAKHHEIWDLVTKIVPSDQLVKMSEFMIYNGEVSGSAGYVFPTNNNLSNPLCILNNADFNVVDISIKDKFVDVLNYS
ncbi:MAG: hypothetical protein GKR88_03610 [Flavobacteriaceae bacterium]|nr:MAG: hypothetical protein GKR88_03610 [Flavobacteriaceae bacterium]